METKSLREKFDMLRFKVHEGKAREAKIDVKTVVLLDKSVLLDKELTTRSNLKGGKYLAYEHGANNNDPDNAHPELTEEDEEEEIIHKPPFLGRLKGRE